MFSDELKDLLRKSPKSMFRADADAFTHWAAMLDMPEEVHHAERAFRFMETHGLDPLRVRDEVIAFRGDEKTPSNTTFRFIDLFAGLGGFRIGCEAHGGRSVFTSEWDRWSQSTFFANHGEVPFGDITEIEAYEIPEHDILCAGFPCQPFSLAGVSKKNSLGRKHGFDDPTQGTLFFDIKRILDYHKPSGFILENVKNLRSHDKGRTFKVIMDTLIDLGYTVKADVLDGKWYTPQHRERIFLVGIRNDLASAGHEFHWPEQPTAMPALGSILESDPAPEHTLTDHLWQYLQDYARKHQAKGNGFGFGLAHPEGITRTLSARYHKDGSEILIPQHDMNPRRLSPLECRRLMGYPESFQIDGIGVSRTQLYRQFGNSVVVPLVTAIAGELTAALRYTSRITAPLEIKTEAA